MYVRLFQCALRYFWRLSTDGLDCKPPLVDNKNKSTSSNLFLFRENIPTYLHRIESPVLATPLITVSHLKVRKSMKTASVHCCVLSLHTNTQA